MASDECEALLAFMSQEIRTKLFPPEPDGIVVYLDITLMDKILGIPKQWWEPGVKVHGQADDLGGRIEVAESAAFFHRNQQAYRPASFKQGFPDRTVYSALMVPSGMAMRENR